MRMILASKGIKKSEKQLVKLLCTNKIRGTWHKNFSVAAKKLRLTYKVESNSSILEIKKFMKINYTVIVCYYIPWEKTDHYSVVKKIDKEHIYFYDPWFGENHKYKISHFLRVWKSYSRYENEKRWLFAVK